MTQDELATIRVFPTRVGMNRAALYGTSLSVRIPHMRGDEPSGWLPRASLFRYSPHAWGSPCKKASFRIYGRGFSTIMETGTNPAAMWRFIFYSTTFGVPETGRVPVRMKVSTRPKTRSLPQKCPRAMEARNSGRRSSKRRNRAGSRVIMSACMP